MRIIVESIGYFAARLWYRMFSVYADPVVGL